MDKEEYTMVSQLLQYTKAVQLLLEWSKQCDFGFDNFRDDEIINWEEFEKETENMDYTESMIYYANKYLNMSDDPTSTRVKDMDVSDFIVQKPMEE